MTKIWTHFFIKSRRELHMQNYPKRNLGLDPQDVCFVLAIPSTLGLIPPLKSSL